MDLFQSPEIDKLVAAIVDAQHKLEPVKKECVNPFYHSKYADLASVWKALSVFTDAGIAITQSPMEAPDGSIVLDTQLTHLSGQWMRSRLTMRVTKNDPQGVGSALTYARRYALGCMTGLVTEEDDDGNLGSKSPIDAAAPRGGKPSQEAGQANVVKSGGPSKEAKELASSIVHESSWVVPFGPLKDQLLCKLADDDVNYLMRYYTNKLKEPANAKSRYREEWEAAVLEIRAELLARYPDAS